MDIRDVLSALPSLPRPVVLLEGGRGGAGQTRLAWGAVSSRRHEWRREDAGDWGLIDWIADGEMRYGFVSYDLGLPAKARRAESPHGVPLAEFFVPEHEMLFDGGGALLTNTDGAAEAIRTFPHQPEIDSRAAMPPAKRMEAAGFDKAGFEAAVQSIRDCIRAGTVYQANISVARLFRTSADPWLAYLRLREINPSPWMGYADFGDWQIVSGSPELLVEVHRVNGDRVVRTRPIAGTRKKTGDPEKDRKMRSELELDEKERAEHLMLVDLARNDIGKVARYGTLSVSELGVLEEYSHVFHLVSEVRGRVRSECSQLDILRAMFPCGTITGVPKTRAMEVIAALEPSARGGYTGTLGWIGPDEMQFNILIRSAFFKDGCASVQAGAGIVWDSIPEREWFESLRKATAVLQALGLEK